MINLKSNGDKKKRSQQAQLIFPSLLPQPFADGVTVVMPPDAKSERVMGSAEGALKAFDAAQPLAPDDAYILYNRGRAYLSLGNQEAARADFRAAMDPKFKQPGARKLAQDALAGLK